MNQENITLYIADFDEQDAITVSQWVYDGEYAIYNCPSWDKIIEQNWAMASEAKRKEAFRKIVDENNSYIGYFRIQLVNQKVVLGLGMNPRYCGKHLGYRFITTIMQYIWEHHCGEIIELEVRSFNKRAIKCYTSCGFEIADKVYKEAPMGNDCFIVMQAYPYEALDEKISHI